MKLHLASGHDYREGWVNVDWDNIYKVDVQANILEPEYWDSVPESSVDAIQVNHFVEHIPHTLSFTKRDGLIWFMEQVYRVMRHGAMIHMAFPYFQSQWAFDDPTHCRFVTAKTLMYFDAMMRKPDSVIPDYGIKADFEIMTADIVTLQAETEGCTPDQIRARMRKEWNVAYENRMSLMAHKPMR